MPGKELTRTIEIRSTPDECYKKICDFESYPDWQSAVKSVRVLKKDKNGRPKHVELRITVLSREFRYVLNYKYDDKKHVLEWDYVEGDLEDVKGSYTFEKINKDKTLATFTAHVDPGVWMPDTIMNVLNNISMRRSMEELRDAIEKE